MKNNVAFQTLLGCNNDDEVFDYLVGHFKETIKSWIILLIGKSY